MPAPLMLLVTLLLGAPLSARADDLILLLTAKSCPRCQLADADLVHADLRNAKLQGAALQGGNLSQANLDGADLSGSNLSFTNLQGASLRGADLRGSRLFGTDLRDADLSGALLTPKALAQSHWIGAKGLADDVLSHAALHNAGVDAARDGRWPDAERLFNAAIKAKPQEPLSWVARALSRGEQGQHDLASRDLAHAAGLYEDQGDNVKADQLLEASRRVQEITKGREPITGNGVGSTLLQGALSTVKTLAPIALKTLIPMLP